MEALAHSSLLIGDFAALGAKFRPVPAEVLDAVGQRLLAIHGHIAPLADPAEHTWTLEMQIPAPVIVYMIRADGHRLITAKLRGGTVQKPHKSPVAAPSADTYTYVVVEATSGALVTGFNAKAGETITIGPATLRPLNNPGLPNGPGELPTPGKSGTPLPANSPPVLVGAGELANGHVLVRTQYWQKSEDSFSLPGCASLNVTLTQSTGITASSSSMESVAQSVSAGASAGWGPISASLSASLSRSSMTSQEVTISATTEATVVHAFSNAYQVGMLVFFWQLVDRFLILTPNYALKAMVETTVLPAIPRAYDPLGQPFPPSGAAKCVVPPPAEGAIS